MIRTNEDMVGNGRSNGLGQLFQDIRYAGRVLRKSPTSTAVIILSLAIGIGTITAVFSITNALFLKPLKLSGL